MPHDFPVSTPPGTSVHLRGLTRNFSDSGAVFDGVNLEITPGEFVAILGPSGCGKTTLLRLIAGLDKPDAGLIHTDPAAPGHSHVGYVFQDAHLLPWRNALDNVALPLELIGVRRKASLSQAARAITNVNLADASARYPAQLSGGMRMRVSLARALVTEPALLLLDEPFAALDEMTRHQLDEQLHQLWYDRRMTVIFVTHSIFEATFLAQRAVVLTHRPARIALDRRLDLPERRAPALRTDARFTREMRFLVEALEQGQTRDP